jgi:hypothetical protein
LVAKPSYVGVGVDGLACPLHHPMVCDNSAFLKGVKPPGLDIGCSIDRLVPVLLNLTWRSSLLPGRAYPSSE